MSGLNWSFVVFVIIYGIFHFGDKTPDTSITKNHSHNTQGRRVFCQIFTMRDLEILYKTFELACKRPNNVVTQPSRNTLSRSETQMGKSPYKKLENTFDTDMLVKPTKLTFSQKIKKILMKMKVKEYKAERFILFCSSYGLVMLCAVLGFLGLAFKIISW